MATNQDLIPEPKPAGITPPANPTVSEVLPPATAAPQADIPEPPAPASVPAMTATPPDPTANVSGAVDQSASDRLGVSRESTTKGQLEDLLSADSTYIKSARERGIRYAAERGLENSSIAGQAGEQAAIESALPIAQSDAATYASEASQRQSHLDRLREAAAAGDTQAQLNYQNAVAQAKLQDRQHAQELVTLSHQGRISSSLQAQQHAERLVELARQGDVTAQLQLQQAGYDSQLSAQQNLERMELAALQGDIEAAQSLMNFNHASLLEQMQQEGRIELTNVQFQHELGVLGKQLENAQVLNTQEAQIWVQQQNQLHQQTLETMEREFANQGARDAKAEAAQLHSQYLVGVSQMHGQASAEITAVYSTQGLTATQQTNAVNEIMRRLTSNIASLGAQFAQSPLWDADWENSAPAPLPGEPGAVPQPVPYAPPEVTNPQIQPVPQVPGRANPGWQPLESDYNILQ